MRIHIISTLFLYAVMGKYFFLQMICESIFGIWKKTLNVLVSTLPQTSEKKSKFKALIFFIQQKQLAVVDTKPSNMSELSEVITSASFHPFQSNIFVYSSSKGLVRMGDMRVKALCDHSLKSIPIFSAPSSF